LIEKYRNLCYYEKQSKNDKFMDEIQLDVELEERIKKLTADANLTVKAELYFVVDVRGNVE